MNSTSDEEVIWQPLGGEICQRHQIMHKQLKKSLEEIWRDDTIFTTNDTVYRLHGWIQELLEHIMRFDRSMHQQLLLLPAAGEKGDSLLPSPS
jgi:hemerythrin